MPAAARRTGSQLVMDAARSVWGHAASARLSGGLTAALGGALALALASWRPDDPSLNASASGVAGNLLGGAGAVVADLCMQSLGLAAWAVAALMLALGLARAAHPEPHATRARLRWRALAGAAGTLLLAGGLAGAAQPAIWPLAAGLGGLIGDGEAGAFDSLAQALGLPVLAPIVLAMLAVAGVWRTAGSTALPHARHARRRRFCARGGRRRR